MKKILSIASFVIFFIALIGVLRIYWDVSSVKREYVIFFLWVLPVIGLLLGIPGKKGFFKTGGLIGNSLIAFVTIVIPYASTLFWNEP